MVSLNFNAPMLSRRVGTKCAYSLLDVPDVSTDKRAAYCMQSVASEIHQKCRSEKVSGTNYTTSNTDITKKYAAK